MEDKTIVELFWQRAENALSAVSEKYGKLCRRLAENILGNSADAEECFNDTLLSLWKFIPPERPENLGAYAAKITRNHALDSLERKNALRRGGGRTAVCLDELDACLPANNGDMADDLALKNALDKFLGTLSEDARKIFMKRYWFMRDIPEIARETGFSESKVKMSLLRSRESLKKHLESEEIGL
ncbi:MAG: sigma-70 family RNA polymerase sigma factor [Clostridia bacterium]|nr:sigma-70 family RNA polymerase sigma factor [Clostridia bacterium]